MTGDGRENVAEKVSSCSFNLHRDHSKSLTFSNVREPSQSWIPKNHSQVQKERGNFVVACVLLLYNLKLGILTSQSCSDGKEMYNKAWCTCKIVVLVIKPIAFLTFSLPKPSSDLKVPITFLECAITQPDCAYIYSLLLIEVLRNEI